jgi:hypothetical protein
MRTRTLTIVVLFAFLGGLNFAACGDDDKPAGTGDGGTTTGDGGTTTGDGATASDGGSSGSCYPSCVADLFTACLPSGTCMTQSSGTNSTTCYSNGYRQSTTYDPGTMTAIIRVEKSGMACYTLESRTSGTTSTITYKNAAGMPVATSTSMTGTPSLVTITCTGGQPVMVDTMSAACRPAGSADASAPMCTPGACP